MFQSLSAIMDNEADDVELEEVLSRITTDQDLRDQWVRLSLIRDLFHSGVVNKNAPDISHRVKNVLEDEPSSVLSRSKTSGSSKFDFFSPIVSFGIAASATVFVVLGGQSFLASENSYNTSYVDGISPIRMTPIEGSSPQLASYRSELSDELSMRQSYENHSVAFEKLRLYGREHAAYSANNTLLGAISYVRVPIEQD